MIRFNPCILTNRDSLSITLALVVVMWTADAVVLFCCLLKNWNGTIGMLISTLIPVKLLSQTRCQADGNSEQKRTKGLLC